MRLKTKNSRLKTKNCLSSYTNHHMRLILPTIVFLFSSLSLYSQNQGWFTYDTTNSAIPSNIVNAVETDNANAIWVGTPNGLAKFEDFFNWTIWNEANSDLPDDWVTCIRQDNAGKMWIGTLAGGLTVLQNGNFTVYNIGNSPLTSNHITAINFEGNVTWITTNGGGLYSFDGNNWQNYNSANTGFEINVCYDVAIDPSGDKWIATLSDGLLKMTGNIFTGFNPTDSDIPFEFVRSVAVENDTSIWVGMGYTNNDSSLARFNGSNSFTIYSEAQTSGIHFRNVWDILVTDEGEKWFCTNDLDHGAIHYNDTVFTDYSSFNSGLPFNRVYGVAKDTGNVWFATLRGLAVFNENNAFFSIDEQPLLLANIYPNPTTENINLILSPQIHQARINIFAMDGKCVMKEQINNLSEGKATIDVNHLKAGFYFAAVQAQGRTDYFKFIKQ